MKTVQRIFANDFGSFFLIAGPCLVESSDITHRIAEELVNLCSRYDIPLIFKGSYRKANRTSDESLTGIGDQKALAILESVRDSFDVPILTDVHETTEVLGVAEVADVLQIPAFLCRQTALIKAAARSQKAVNIKKGQFMSAESMSHASRKAKSENNEHIFLTERGTFFGYQDLVVDPRSIYKMAAHDVTIIDVTHATQKPNQSLGFSGGDPKMAQLLGRVGLSAGAKGIFMETHPNPDQARSDASSMIPLERVEQLIVHWKRVAQMLRDL